jgi:hypothetical protein
VTGSRNGAEVSNYVFLGRSMRFETTRERAMTGIKAHLGAIAATFVVLGFAMPTTTVAEAAPTQTTADDTTSRRGHVVAEASLGLAAGAMSTSIATLTGIPV